MVSQVHNSLVSRVFTETPKAVTPAIRDLCRELSPDQQPTYVDIAPEPPCKRAECFPNVAQKVERDGGEILYGWAIWEWPRVFIEAEHHAVWSKDSTLLDITPNDLGISRVLFLPDPERRYDFEGGKPLANVRRPLANTWEISEWIRLANYKDEIRRARSRGNMLHLSAADIDILTRLDESMREVKVSILCRLANSTRRNDPCFCGSGRKFKVCCAQYVQ